MYTVSVEAEFRAVHRLRLSDGTLEPRHGHEWRVRAHFTRAELDEADMVIDFDEARAGLESVVALLHETDLNRHEALAGANPTAEIVAKYVFDQICAQGLFTIRRVEVIEAPGCAAVFEPSRPSGSTEQAR